jgi:hypothetical protein
MFRSMITSRGSPAKSASTLAISVLVASSWASNSVVDISGVMYV